MFTPSLPFVRLSLVVVSALTAACAAGASTSGDAVPPPSTPDGAGSTVPDDPSTAPPHALGTILLGESRSSGTGDSKPLISASFVPDAKLVKSCTTKVGACEVAEAPKCTTGSVDGCATGEVCTYDDDCTAKCVKACTKSCSAGEVCAFDGTSSADGGSDAGMTCKKRDRFDAGAIAFAGTTQALTLFPPYAVTPDGNGAPFLARTEIQVQATGGVTAGFAKFDEKFTSTTFLETNPPLSELSPSEVFGSGALTIGWVPGEDTVYVTASGSGGSAKCTADDKSGTFELPRAILRQVTTSEDGAGGSGGLSITVSRERHEVRKNQKTFGELSGGQTIQPEGWLELVTRSSESHAFQSCTTGKSFCGDTCVSLQSDAQNCGACGKKCPSGYYCSAGSCTY